MAKAKNTRTDVFVYFCYSGEMIWLPRRDKCCQITNLSFRPYLACSARRDNCTCFFPLRGWNTCIYSVAEDECTADVVLQRCSQFTIGRRSSRSRHQTIRGEKVVSEPYWFSLFEVSEQTEGFEFIKQLFRPLEENGFKTEEWKILVNCWISQSHCYFWNGLKIWPIIG